MDGFCLARNGREKLPSIEMRVSCRVASAASAGAKADNSGGVRILFFFFFFLYVTV
jgi:hypothetical protein